METKKNGLWAQDSVISELLDYLMLAKNSISSPSNRLDYITNRLNLAKTSMSSLSNRLYLANPCCFREFNRLSNKNNRLFLGIHLIGKYKQSIGLSENHSTLQLSIYCFVIQCNSID
ncbi:uncharacterized protein DS421_8g241210 [Arachis hypogaea]|nr:uncharacterized protein DS421_8g241210 [Arachis hypogaea]